MNKYPFNQSIAALEAFVANFSARINNIKNDLPVFALNTGDETYYFEKKFKPKNKDDKFKEKDINSVVPRIVLDFGDSPNFLVDQNTNQYVNYEYVYNNVHYTSKARRLAYEMVINTILVTSNFIKAMEYFDMIASMVSTDKSLTYEYLGNTFESNYRISTFAFERNTLDAGTKTNNFLIRISIDYNVQLFAIDYQTIKVLSDGNSPEYSDERDKIVFELHTNDVNGTKEITKLDSDSDCEDCE